MQERSDERSLGELFGDLGRQLTSLIHKEVELARTELTHNASRMARSFAVVAAGGALAYAGVLVLLAAVVLVFVEAGVDGWLAALLVGGAALAAGIAVAVAGRSALTAAELAPERTIETLKEDAEWAREQTR